MLARRHFLMSAAPALLLAGATKGALAADKANVRLVLDWKFEGEHAQFAVPATDGTFDKLGLNVKIDRGNGSGDTVAKVASGAYDVGFADTLTMVRFNAHNPNSKLISVAIVQDASASGVVALRSKGINKPTDLNGKKIYAPVADAGRQLFPVFAAKNGIDVNSIQWNTVTGDLRDTMLARKEADAVTSNICTTVMNLRAVNVPESDLAVFFYGRLGVDLCGSSIITTPAYAEKNGDTIRKFITGLVHGLNTMVDDQKKSMAALKTLDNLLNDDIEKARMLISLRDMLITPNVLKNGFSSMDTARMDRMLNEVCPTFKIPTPAAADVYTAAYLPSAADRKVHPWTAPAKI